MSDQTALVDGRQDRHLVVEGFTKPSTMVQMQWGRVVPKHLKRFVMMSVHVSHEEVENRHIHDVQKSPPFIIRVDLLHEITVIVVNFPLRLASLVIASAPRVTPHLAGSRLFSRQEDGEGSL